MTPEYFNELVENQFQQCRKLLCSKAKEYARDDRLSNFKKAGNLQDCKPVTALWGMAIKHIVSIADYVNDFEKGNVHSLSEWDEKIGDAMNYLLLMKGLIVEALDE